MQEALEQKILLLDAWYRGDKPFFVLHGYGGIYSEREHVFPTNPLKSISQQQNVLNAVKENSVLNGHKIILKPRPHHVVQIMAPVSEKKELPKQFVTGHYRSQILTERRPGMWVSVPADVLDALAQKNEFNKRLIEIREEIAKQFYGRNKGYTTRLFNELNQLVSEGRISEIENNAFAGKISKSAVEKRMNLADIYSQIRSKFNIVQHKDKKIDIILPDIKMIKPLSQITYDEFTRLSKLFLDSELPGWDTGDPKLTPYILHYQADGKLSGEVHTLRKSSKGEEYEVMVHGSQKDLITEVRNSVKRENPQVIFGHNLKVDVIDFPKAVKFFDDFDIGLEGTRPHYEATSPFNERIGVYGRIVIDGVRLAKICFDLPSYKLESVISHLQRIEKRPESDRYKKAVSYSDVTVLDKKAEEGDIHSSDILNDYGWKDTISMRTKFFNTMTIQRNIRLGLRLQDSFGVPLSWLLWSPNSINFSQVMKYFDAVGTYRELIFREGAKFKEEKAKARSRFSRMLEEGLERKLVMRSGDYKNVHQAYMPYGYYLSGLILKNFPDAEKLFSIAKPDDGREKLSRNELFFLSKYANAMLNLITVDSAALDILEKDVENSRNQGELFTNKKKKTDFEKLQCEMFKQRNKIYGNYRISPKEVRIAMEKYTERVKNFIERNDIRILYQKGPRLFLLGNPAAFSSSNHCPLIKIDEIGEAWFAVKNGKRTFTYKKDGYFSRRKLNEDMNNPALFSS